MNVLVTGASGFLGSVLMARKPAYVGVDTKGSFSSMAQFDIRDEKLLEKFIIENEITRIVHLAGVQFIEYVKPKARRDFFAQNIEMATSIRNVALRTSIDKIVYVSTDMVYGDKVKSPVSEKIAPSPIGEYGASKLKAEGILFDNQGLFKVVVLRPRLILGVGRVGTIQKLADLIDSPFPIVLIGSGENSYQFISAEDVCKAIELSLSLDVNGVFNIGSDNPPNLNDLFDKTLANLGKNKLIVRVPARFGIFMLDVLDKLGISPLTPEQYKIAPINYVLDTKKIKFDMGWTPSLTDEEMLTSALKDLLG